MDRRILKTRQVIMDAFIQLMGDKGFEKITINEIAERANVNRGTIYLHYVDKYDLLDQCIATYMDKLVQYCTLAENLDEAPTHEALHLTFEYLKENFQPYAILMKNEGVPFFRNHLSTIIIQMLKQSMTKNGESKGIVDDITVQFLTSAIVGIIEWWVANAMPCTVDEVTKQLWTLLLPFSKLVKI